MPGSAAGEQTRLEERAGRGRCVVAARSLEPATVVSAFSGAPYAAVPLPSYRDRVCAACLLAPGAGSRPLRRCSACKQARYCCADCQQSDWRLHRHECAVLADAGSLLRRMPEAAAAELLLAARCLRRRCACMYVHVCRHACIYVC